ncbi:hypothetical protein nbrc107696_15490 [Gordonia spumicola]|uniref:Helicase XPB/Ssl2 N-terminal domain-containing protein n=1 Tax=Gordonia spumicola TaxID=589161 RepID=A0A7I9V7P5_9ACTN|nr:hypothetical protein nbrc107696_15490 [Gordonia spumicola]
MSPDQHPRTASEELASRPDDRLVDLLVRRPDLASPPPRGTGVLAQRAMSAASISLAGDELDLLAIAVLEAFLDCARKTGDAARTTGDVTPRHDLLGPVGRDDIVALLGRRALRADVDARLALLSDRALIWPARQSGRKATHWVAGAHLPSALPWRAPHLLGPLASVDAARIADAVAALDDRPRELLTTLAQGPALGRSRDAAPDADPAAPVPRLLAADLLARVDEQTVELPPQVGQVLRGEPPLQTAALREPALTGEPSRYDVDAAGAGEALELLRHTADVIGALGDAPAAVLRSGGMGIRELRRLAKSTGLTVTRVGLVIELLAAARLIGAGTPESMDALTVDEVFAPTTTVDGWRAQGPERRWASLATAWLDLPRRASQIGETDRDGAIIGALASESFDASAPALRRTVLEPLTDADPAVEIAVDSLVTLLGWRHPRQLRRLTRSVVGETLREATELGLVAHGSLTSVGRALLAVDPDADDGSAALVAAMAAALPEPIDYFLVQADFTVTVPGPLTSGLADRLALVADLESGGAASVYRVTEDGIRRALDAGRTAAELSALFTDHSKTPVPQSLTYLIDDVARRHGSLRVGDAHRGAAERRRRGTRAARARSDCRGLGRSTARGDRQAARRGLRSRGRGLVRIARRPAQHGSPGGGQGVECSSSGPPRTHRTRSGCHGRHPHADGRPCRRADNGTGHIGIRLGGDDVHVDPVGPADRASTPDRLRRRAGRRQQARRQGEVAGGGATRRRRGGWRSGRPVRPAPDHPRRTALRQWSGE